MTKLCEIEGGATITYDPGDGSEQTLYVPYGTALTYEEDTLDEQTEGWPVLPDPTEEPFQPQ